MLRKMLLQALLAAAVIGACATLYAVTMTTKPARFAARENAEAGDISVRILRDKAGEHRKHQGGDLTSHKHKSTHDDD
ncbi:hypothetical protein [Ferrovibrio sp.]|uniref:hypothetical protein n=1 Tax=Ferrovibrio sp. TaxID=1917215 RepID=UPI001B5884A8|nr:hypothetical protein [Ferrovibrio sp.]MBP7065047.1 hypothetical protein [Ferrovibrio sp.]